MAHERTQDDVVIVSAVRTPFGKFGGLLKDVPGIELAVTVIREVLLRTGETIYQLMK